MADHATDEQLLEQAANGNTAAFQILYERYRDPIFRFAFRLLGSVEAAEDVAQDCFVSLIKAPARFDASRASLRTYLYGAARNQASKRYQGLGRETAIDELADEPHSADRHGPMALVLDDELAGALRRRSQGDREALLLRYWEELEPAQIAQAMGCARATIAVRLHRARLRLRRGLEAVGDRPEEDQEHEDSCVTGREPV